MARRCDLWLMSLVWSVSWGSAWACPLPPAAVCQIEGTVISVSDRHEDYDKVFGRGWYDKVKALVRGQTLPEGHAYVDVTVDITQENVYDSKGVRKISCEGVTGVERRVYQLGQTSPTTLLARPQIGEHIQARTHKSGDEFVAGNWLFNIKTLP